MAIVYNTSIVRDGLVFYVDVANVKSYPGSGTTVTDLGSTRQSGATTNVTISGGALSFSANGVVDFGTSLTSVDATDKTMVAWINPTALVAGNGPTSILDKDLDTDQGWGFWMTSGGKLWFWPNSGQDIKDNGSLSAALNTWTMITTTFSYTGKSCNFYYNGNLSSTVTNSSATPGGSSATRNLLIGAFRNNTGAKYSGLIGPVMLYNKVLSAGEIQQNFNAMRGRYGI